MWHVYIWMTNPVFLIWCSIITIQMPGFADNLSFDRIKQKKFSTGSEQLPKVTTWD